MARTNEKSTNELYQAFVTAHDKDRTGRDVRDPAVLAALGSEIRAGIPLIVIKKFKSGGRIFEVGEEFLPGDDDIDIAVRMARHGYLLPRDVWAKSQRYYQDKVKAEEAGKLHTEWMRIQTELGRAKAEVADLAARLTEAENKVKGLMSSAERMDADLRSLLLGEK